MRQIIKKKKVLKDNNCQFCRQNIVFAQFLNLIFSVAAVRELAFTTNTPCHRRRPQNELKAKKYLPPSLCSVPLSSSLSR
jgi:hypothetical protein